MLGQWGRSAAQQPLQHRAPGPSSSSWTGLLLLSATSLPKLLLAAAALPILNTEADDKAELLHTVVGFVERLASTSQGQQLGPALQLAESQARLQLPRAVLTWEQLLAELVSEAAKLAGDVVVLVGPTDDKLRAMR